MSKKRAKFEDLATSRVNKAIKIIRLISNLANKSHYTYNSEDADKIVNALNQEIKILKDKFNSNKSKFKNEFKL